MLEILNAAAEYEQYWICFWLGSKMVIRRTATSIYQVNFLIENAYPHWLNEKKNSSMESKMMIEKRANVTMVLCKFCHWTCIYLFRWFFVSHQKNRKLEIRPILFCRSLFFFVHLLLFYFANLFLYTFFCLFSRLSLFFFVIWETHFTYEVKIGS